MIDYEQMRQVIAKGLKNYIGCPVIRSSQNAEPPPYPYVSYTITTLSKSKGGTYSIAKDGTRYKEVTQTWSFTALSDNASESMKLALKMKEWVDLTGNIYLSDNGIVANHSTDINNRDNLLTTEYEYRNGFDAVFSVNETITAEEANGGAGYIETVEFKDIPPINKEE